MSVNGLQQQYIPPTLDGLNVVEADQIYIDGTEIKIDDLVPYTGANKTIDANSQIIKTTHIATTNPEVVNKQLLDSTISNLVVSIAGSFLDKVTTTPQTVIGNTTFTAQLTADNLVVPATKVANIGTVVEVGPNYKQAVNDASVTVGQYFGTITSSLGVYESTSSQDMGTVILGAALTVGQRYRVYINVLGSDTSDTNVVMYQSSNGTTFNASIVSEYFDANSTIFRVMNQTFTASYPYVILALFTAGGGATLKWFGLERYEVGVELEKVTLPLLTASKVPILNDKKQLVSSGTDASKLDYLDNVGSDIQTQLNSKLNLSGSNANQNIVIGSYKVQSSATPSIGDDYTNKTYVDGAITGLASTYAKLAGPQTFTNTHTFDSATPINLSGLTAYRVLITDASKNVQVSGITSTELSYLYGVTGLVQTQIDSKASTSYVNTQDGLRVLKTGDTMTGILTNSIANPYADRSTNPLPSYNIVASSNSQRLYMGSYYTAGQGACATIQSSDYYSGLDHGTSLLINPLGGSVGIGTSDVLGVFNIYHDGSTQFLTLQNATFSSGQYVSLRFMFGKNNAANVSSYIRSYLDSNDATDLRFYTDNGGGFAEQMRITDAGTVGIGITSPIARLQVNYSAGEDYLTLSNTNYALDNYINFRFMFGPSTGTRSAYIQAHQPGSNQTNLRFFVDSGSGSVTERFRIQGNGSILAFGPLGVQTAAPEGDLHVQLASAVNDYWGKLKVKTTSFWGDGTYVRSETAGTQYGTIFPIMLLNPHIVSTDDGWCPIRLGRSGGIASGTWWEVATRADGNFQIGKERDGGRFLLDGNGSGLVSASFTIGSGGEYRAGCIYSDSSIGMLFRGVQTANAADFRWDRSNGTELMRITNNGVFDFSGGGTTYAVPYQTTRAGSVVIGNINNNYDSAWQAGLLLECADNTEIQCHDSGTRLVSMMYYQGASVNRFYIGRDIGWGTTPVSIMSNLGVNGYLTIGAAAVCDRSTYNQTDIRMMFRDGTAVDVGACSFWQYRNPSVAWTYGLGVNYAFYVSSTTATIVIHVTGSGYGAYPGKTYFNVTVQDVAVPSSYYSTDISHYFNVTYSHTQITQHITIPNNAWGGNTVGWKSMYLGWTYGAVSVDSDANDTLQFSVSVIG